MSRDNQLDDPEFEAQYKTIKADVKKVVVTNLIILSLLIIAFFINKQIGFVDKLLNIF